MIPTLPGTSDILTGPERPEPTWAPPPAMVRSRLDDFEELKKAVANLQAKVENLEALVLRLETGLRAR